MKTEKRKVLETISEMYNEIFKAEKKVADYILKNPEKTIVSNVSELANYSGVSDATVIRLCKHLGFSGYYELKISLSREIGQSDHPAVDGRKALENSVGAYFRVIGDRVAEIGSVVEEDVFQKIVDLLCQSSRVYTIALGNTAPLAMYFGFRLECLGIRCSMNLQPEYFVNHINLAQEGECVLAISRTGTTKSVTRAMEFAKDKGLKVVAVTGYRYSPMTRLADYVLLSFPDNTSLEKESLSRLPELVVLDVMLEALEARLSPEHTLKETPEMVLSSDKY